MTTKTKDGAWQTFKRGLQLSPGLRNGLVGTVILAVIATTGRTVVPITIQRTIDIVAAAPTSTELDLDRIFQMIAIAAVAVIITGLATSRMNVRLATVTETALAQLRTTTFEHIHNLSMLSQASERRGQLVARVTSDVDQISRFLQYQGVTLLVAFGQITIALGVMLFYSWRITTALVVTTIPFFFVGRYFQRRVTMSYVNEREAFGKMLSVLSETVLGASVIRAYRVADQTGERVNTAVDEHRHSGVVAGGWAAGFSGIAEMFTGIETAVALIVGTVLVAEGVLSVGTVLAFPFLVVLFTQPILYFAEGLNEAQVAVAGWGRVLDLLDIPLDVPDPGPSGTPLPSGNLAIVFRDVSFLYPLEGERANEATGPQALSDVSVTIHAGQHIAVVGETGSGKTTFAKILTRLMDPTSGEVCIGGVPTTNIPFESLRERVVMVAQDDALLSGTVADNVGFGRHGADVHDVRDAFDALGLGEWLQELPEGVHTDVGERGTSLSVGERQLLALARAHLANPDILVLDEATSSVDPATESRVQAAMARLTEGRTTVVIAHRLSTAAAAERVLVFDSGTLVEHGPHVALVANGGVYARLWNDWQATTGTE